MSLSFRHLRFSVLVTVSLLCTSTLWGVKPAAEILPATTRLYVSFPDVELAREAFGKTQLGELARDPVMKPFADDLGQQLRERFGDTQNKLGLSWDDLEGVYAGEACLARTQPDGDPNNEATALLVDVTGRSAELDKVLAKIEKNMEQRKATRSSRNVHGVEVTIYQLPKRRGEIEARQAVLSVVDEQLVAADNVQLATEIVGRSQAADGNALSDGEVFRTVMAQLVEESGGQDAHVRWYIDPFRYAEVVRASNGGRRRRGKDMLQILKNQGFTAVQAMGGLVNLATESHEILHRTFIYAPAVTDEPTRYEKAARLLSFPSSQHLPAPNWVPRSLATYLSWNWQIKEGFEHSISLVDEIVDSEGFVDDVLKSFETDPTGPQINVRTELLAFMKERVMIVSDFELPISTKSERLLAAIPITDEQQVANALQKLWQTDPQANERRIGDKVVWEIVPEQEDAIPDLEISGVPVPGGDLPDDEEGEEIKLPNAAMTVAHGCLLVATHVDFLASVLTDRPTHDTLGGSVDFQLINEHLEKLGAGEESLRFFSRTDEEYRSAYEMIRRGKMPESESLLGKLLNRMLGPKEKGVLRKQKLDGKSLPDYQIVRRYLGPAGLFMKPHDNGWVVTGIMVSKQQLVEDSAAHTSLKTAATGQ